MYRGISLPIRFSEEEIARHIVAAREISLTLLPLMPELLSEEAYANVIDAYDSATLKAFWQIQLPAHAGFTPGSDVGNSYDSGTRSTGEGVTKAA